ncbi:hypothetical protein AMAG_07554 [Allomyces macrogynus ATCC 38327]|uniref:DM13 domain-containing protein n=1 Tax=Allomyces macrogynus (strain ATCC 38327) TaxID=578462 RepID=A0A0L0SIJ0_ALLM3|nr:hypothetical protein AMAG_07554 [Allomyces macrogynus ATCC 38327]|eukprot:KNE62323.1 hypothetical protein AMAG_07554 [Allomyces macrogynus ATCC 38327]
MSRALLHAVFATIAVLALAAAALAANCDKGTIPNGIQRNVPLVPTVSMYPDLKDVNLQVSGFVDYIDGCTIVLKNFTYLPDLGSTQLYAVKGDVKDENAFPVSGSPVLGSDGHVDQKFVLNRNQSLADFNIIKLFSVDRKVLIAYAALYNTTAGSATSAGGASPTPTLASGAAATSFSAGAAAALVVAAFAVFAL